MKIRKALSIVITILMVLGVFVALPPKALSAAPSSDKASIYVKITATTSYQRTDEIEGYNESGVTDKKVHADRFSVTVEGTTELKSDIFSSDDEYKELLPYERDITARCSGGGSINISGMQGHTKPNDPSTVKDFPFSSKEVWNYAMDGKELLNENDEFIELVYSLTVIPPEEKGETPTYEINFNGNALTAINYFHTITRGTRQSHWQNFEGNHSDSAEINEGGDYGASSTPGTGYFEAFESGEVPEDFIKGKFKLENDKFVSSGRFSYNYKPNMYEECLIDVQFTINRDPQIKNIQVNQVLGRYEYIDEDNYVPATDFVAGKETAIQVFFFKETPIDKIEDVKLEVYRDGAKIATLKDFKRDKDNNALNFIPSNKAQCENWKEGHYKFKALYKDTEFVLDNVKMTKIPKLRILAVPLKANYEGVVKSPGNSWRYGHRFLRVVYPIAKEDVEWVIRPDPLDVSSYMFNLKSNLGKWKVSEELKKLQASNAGSQYDAIVGFIAESTENYTGYTYRDLSVVVSESEPDMPATVAHEIGHLYNLGEEYQGGSYNTFVNMPPYGYSGIDWYDRNKLASGTDENIKASNHGEGVDISTDLHPFEVGSRGLLEESIGFMGSSVGMDYIWITPSVWRHLFNVFELKSNKTPKDNDVENNIALRPAGHITDSGEIVVEYPWRVTYIEDEPITQAEAQTGTYEIQALDAVGTVLARQYFTPSFFSVTYTGQSGEASEMDKFSLNNVSLPFPEGTVKFNFMKDNTPIKEIPVSENAPRITLTTSFDGGEFTGSKAIEWIGNDADGDKLYYTVEYSHNGTQWSVLQPDITDSYLTVDFGKLPGGEKALIRVIASDGINSTKVDSNTFKVPNKPPELFVEDAYVSDDGVTLSASAYDSADGWIYDDRITFTSNKDGEIGKGSTLFLTNLSVGNHVVTITAENNHGQKVEGEINFTVGKSKKDLSGLLSGVTSGLPAIDKLKGVIFWTIVVIGIIILLVILVKSKKKKCPQCGKKSKKKISECPQCGYYFSSGNTQSGQKQSKQEQQQVYGKYCRNCGKLSSPGARFCAGCGSPIIYSQNETKKP